jgi:hypothetical protein
MDETERQAQAEKLPPPMPGSQFFFDGGFGLAADPVESLGDIEKPVEDGSRFAAEQRRVAIVENPRAALVDDGQREQPCAQVVEIALLSVLGHEARLESIALGAGERAHAHFAAPFGNGDGFCFQVFGGQDRGFVEDCHVVINSRQSRRKSGFARRV